MKTTILFFSVLAFQMTMAQINQEIKTQDGHQFLVGEISVDGLQSEPYNDWFEPNFTSYGVDEHLVGLMKKHLKKHKIKLFLGTWCGDSKREVPRFLKILKAAKFPDDNLEIIAVDRRKEFYKTSPGGEEKGLNIVKVPTLIFFKNGQEVNRIIERPIDSLEEDILAIVSKKSYTPNYADLKRTK